jgi:hypothetical protein
MLSAALLSMFVVMVVGGLLYGREHRLVEADHDTARMIAEEGLEATRSIRDTNNFSAVTVGVHGLGSAGNVWQFSGASDVVDTSFTRSVTVSTLSLHEKKVSSNVTWNNFGRRAGSITLSSILTDWRENGWGNPHIIQNFSLTNAVSAVVQGNYAYIVTSTATANFKVLDLSTWTIVGSTSVPSVATDVAISGNYAFVTSKDNAREFASVNVTNPNAPVLLASYNAPGNPDGTGVAISGNYAYFIRDAAGGTELNAIDISSPGTLILASALLLDDSQKDIVISGNYAYIASASNTTELAIANISNPNALALAGSLNLAGATDANAVGIIGNTAILGMVDGTTRVINISTPSAPVLLSSSFSVGTKINSIATYNAGSIVFFATQTAQGVLQVASLSGSTLSLAGSLGIATQSGLSSFYNAATDKLYMTTSAPGNQFIEVGP